MQCLNKVKQYIKENRLYILVMAIGCLFFTIQMKHVVLYADDLSLGIEAKKGFLENVKYLIHNYLTWGGGPTPLIAIFFMKFKIRVWKVFNIVIVSLIVHISVKMINSMSKANKAILAILIWSFIFIIDIYVSRETLYWLDGSLAYVLTSFQVLIYFYYLYSKMILNNEIKKYDYVLLPTVAFFSGWTGPQMAVITVLIDALLIAWKKIVKKEKISKIVIIAIAFSILGTLIEIISPGNNGRMYKTFPEFAQFGLIEKMLYRANIIYYLIFNFKDYGLGSIAFFSFMTFGIISIIAYEIAKKEENKKFKVAIRIISGMVIIFIGLTILIRLNLLCEDFGKILLFNNLQVAFKNHTVDFNVILPYICSSLIMAFTSILSIYISIKKNKPVLFIAFISALVSHGIMIVAPYTPLRSTFTSLMFLWISLAVLIQVAMEENIKISYIIIVALGIIKKELGIIGLIVYYILENFYKDNKHKDILIICFIFIALASSNWQIVNKNYKTNEQIYNQNISRIENFVREQDKETQKKELYIIYPNDVRYGFTPMAGEEWIKKDVKKFFGIKENVEIEFESTK